MYHKQLSLFEILETNIPKYGIGETAFIPINGGTKVIIDKVMKNDDSFVYSCHEDTLYQFGHIVSENELFHYNELNKANEIWTRMKERYLHLNSADICIEESQCFKIVFSRPQLYDGYLGRIHSRQYGLIADSYLYQCMDGKVLLKRMENPKDAYEQLVLDTQNIKDHAIVFEQDSKIIVPDLFTSDRIIFRDWNSFSLAEGFGTDYQYETFIK